MACWALAACLEVLISSEKRLLHVLLGAAARSVVLQMLPMCTALQAAKE